MTGSATHFAVGAILAILLAIRFYQDVATPDAKSGSDTGSYFQALTGGQFSDLLVAKNPLPSYVNPKLVTVQYCVS
eukprot:GDKH01021661.1.p3 GENE.GDKH01021661.1~~GDKH01021661.1.p3  ORF type:complete len:76 (+),score=9.46 GDKH01021661.1:165-392(+)